MSAVPEADGGDLAGRVAIVTGAGDAQGLGFAHARHLAARGARIVLNDLGGGTLGLPEQGVDAGIAARAAALLRAEGAEVVDDNGDVADPSTATRMVEAALDTWGRLDIVVNNAGIASAQFFPDVDPDELRRHVGVTLQGCLNTARAAWPHLVACGRGRIVNTGSPACFGNEIASYAATKAGLFGLTRTTAIFGRAHGITANLILPAAVSRLTLLLPESPFKDVLRERFGADEVAPLVGHLVSPDCTVSGEAFLVGGGSFARVVYAASPTESLAGDAAAVAAAVGRTMAAHDWTPMGSTRESTTHLGLPPD
jgi:NAD(P)-dependent dehydrogenase (short-subunit alcohol dehydrogenase family)